MYDTEYLQTQAEITNSDCFGVFDDVVAVVKIQFLVDGGERKLFATVQGTAPFGDSTSANIENSSLNYKFEWLYRAAKNLSALNIS